MMKMRLLALLLLASLAAHAQAPAAKKEAPPAGKQTTAGAAAREWNQLKFPPLRDVTLPEIKRYTLSNGIRLFVVEDHRLPLVDGYALVRTGSRWEPADKVGLASITGSVMRTGGTRSKTGDQLDEELESIAASVESSISQNSGSAGFSALKQDLDRVLAIWADVIMNPEFRQDKIDLAKTFARTGISRRNDDAGDINSREFRKLMYGATSPYARHTEYATIDAIRREDLVAFHRRYYHPNNTIIGISGDINPDEVRQKVEKVFGTWKPDPGFKAPAVPEVRPPDIAPVNFVRKEDVNQTSVRIGHLGGLLKDPDYFALDVMAEILAAGGFSSRITQTVRSKLGLAYAAGGDWNAEFDYPGTFSIFVGTKSESTVKAIEATLNELQRIRESEVTETELQIAKESILNAFVFNFTSPAQVMNRIITYIYYGYPEDFLQQYKANIEKVTRADVLRVAKQHLHPDQVKIMAVGNDKEFDKPLASLALAAGKVNAIDVTIPEGKPAAAKAAKAAAPASPASAERGRAVLAAVQKFLGGAERVRAIKDLSTTTQIKATTPQGDFEILGKGSLILPSTLRNEQTLPMGTIVTFYDGTTGWAATPQGTKELPDSRKQAIRAELTRNNLILLFDPESVSYEGQEKVGDKQADVITVTKAGETARLAVDPATGMLLRKSYRAPSPMGGGLAEMEEFYLDYTEVDGWKFPRQVRIDQNGSKFLEVRLTDVKVNSGLKVEELARKPQ